MSVQVMAEYMQVLSLHVLAGLVFSSSSLQQEYRQIASFLSPLSPKYLLNARNSPPS